MDLDMLPSPDELPAASGNVERLLELFRLHMESLPPFFASYHIKESHVTEKTFRSFLETIDSDENLSKWVNEQASFNYYPDLSLLSWISRTELQTLVADQFAALVDQKIHDIQARHPRTRLAELVKECDPEDVIDTKNDGQIHPSKQWRIDGCRNPSVVLDVCAYNSPAASEISTRAAKLLDKKRGEIGTYVSIELDASSPARFGFIRVWRFDRNRARRTVVGRRFLNKNGTSPIGGVALRLDRVFRPAQREGVQVHEIDDAVLKERVFVGYQELADMVKKAQEHC